MRNGWLLAFILIAQGCARPPGDSAGAGFATAKQRVAWMKDRMRVRPPSPVKDAHFLEQEQHVPHTHMGLPYTMYWFSGRIEIDPKDAPAWISRLTQTAPPVMWQRDQNPLVLPHVTWGMSPTEFDSAVWYDPAPLFSRSAHGGYQAGHVAVTQGGACILVWQHWR